MKKHRWLWIGATVLLIICFLVVIISFCVPSRTVWDLATMINSPDGAIVWMQDEHFHSVNVKREEVIEILNNLRLSYPIGTRSFDWNSNRIVFESTDGHKVQYFLFI